jgi:ATP-dependent DNA helicase RecG
MYTGNHMADALTIRDQINELNRVGESERLEAKRCSELGNSFFESVCAFSNEPELGGGTILLGVVVEEDVLFPLYSPVGVPNVDKVLNDISTGCASKFNSPIRVNVDQEEIGNAVVIRVVVPEAPQSAKPLYFTSKGLPGGAYRRIAASDIRCTADDLNIFFAARSTDTYDKSILVDTSFDDVDPDAVHEYRIAREKVNPDAEELKWNDEELLNALGCMKKVDGECRLNVGGLVLFGKAQALRRTYPTFRVDYIRVPGTEWVENPEKRFESADFRAPLMLSIRKILNNIAEDIPVAFSLPDDAAQREDLPVVPNRALREAVVNAVMHRNYQAPHPIQVVRYQNRLQIANPGFSLKSEERFGEPGSELRNPIIAATLHETLYAETKGSGIRAMREYMRKAGRTPPTFESDRDNDRFEVTFLFHQFLNEQDLEWLAQFKDDQLTNEQARALIFVRERGAINNAAYRDINGVETLVASFGLRRLRDIGLLELKGSSSRTYYVASERLRATLVNGDSAILDKDSDILDSDQSIIDKAVEGSEDLPTELRETVKELGKRAKPDTFHAVIMKLCSWKALTAEEIAVIVKKDKTYISAEFLSKMIKSGVLEYTIPDMPKHPDQAYKTPKEPR